MKKIHWDENKKEINIFLVKKYFRFLIKNLS